MVHHCLDYCTLNKYKDVEQIEESMVLDLMDNVMASISMRGFQEELERNFAKIFHA